MRDRFDIPKELAHLKLDERGYPIPFFAVMTAGKPNFRLQDDRKRDICIDEKRCPICGKKLAKGYCYIVTGPVGLKNRLSSDAMMHRGCAEFSLRACPHLHFESAERKEDPGPVVSSNKPKEMYLVKVSSFEAVHLLTTTTCQFTGRQEFTGVRLIRYTPVSWEQYIYQNNVLVRNESGDDQDLK
jgi:hypothetical protein